MQRNYHDCASKYGGSKPQHFVFAMMSSLPIIYKRRASSVLRSIPSSKKLPTKRKHCHTERPSAKRNTKQNTKPTLLRVARLHISKHYSYRAEKEASYRMKIQRSTIACDSKKETTVERTFHIEQHTGEPLVLVNLQRASTQQALSCVRESRDQGTYVA